MRSYRTVTLGGAVLATVLLALSAFAHEHIALNGVWVLAPKKSDFAGDRVMKSGTITIDEREGNITVSRSFAYGDGDDRTVFYNDSTDSQNGATVHRSDNLKSKIRWDHDVLTVTTTAPSGAVTTETYRSGPDGTMLVNVAKPDQRPFTLVFERQ